ncbi:MAG: hypothetical protein MUE41_13185 [Gemmatimonadaceae bacterium]|nr:hypothetical protein [Gemmatimonadaceae bacterium]
MNASAEGPIGPSRAVRAGLVALNACIFVVALWAAIDSPSPRLSFVALTLLVLINSVVFLVRARHTQVIRWYAPVSLVAALGILAWMLMERR